PDNSDRGSEEGEVLGPSADPRAAGRFEWGASMKRSAGLFVFVFLFAGTTLWSAQAPAQTNTVLKAMTDELQRSVSELQFKDLEKPYFIQYVILDREQYQAEATFGGLLASKKDRARLLQAQVRVGDYDFDNSEFIAQGFQPQSGVLTTTIID